MPFYLATVTLATTSGIAADKVENTYAFSGSNAGTDVVAIDGLLSDLYDDLAGTYSQIVSGTGHEISIVNLDDPQPRYPIYIAIYAFPSTPTGASTARELAICSSFQADRQSGIPQARRRGRVYIGPIDSALLDSTGMLTPTAVNNVVAAFDTFWTAAASSAVVWSVYSRVDQDLYAISNGWVDNAPDVQRRRGTAATLRTTWS